MNKILIIDTETTDADPETCEYIEVAYLDIDSNLRQVPLVVNNNFDKFYKPTKAIALGALATHHIHIDTLTNCKPTGSFILPQETTYIIGHNVDFDWKVLGSPDVKRIDTLALARFFEPTLDSHTQSALLYYIQGEAARGTLKEAHNALADAYICRTILEWLLARYIGEVTIEQLWGVSEMARVPKVMAFGKHKGEEIVNVPAGYKQWLLKQDNVDPYLRKALGGK